MRTTLLSAAALASVFALAACNKNGAGAPAPVDAANNSVAASSSPIAATQDATAGAVGQVAAAATMTTGGFVTAAATSDMYEVAAAKIAMARSKNPEIKRFAAKMAHEHSASTAKLKSVLASGVVATPPTELDERRKGLINNLNVATPAEFDKTYIDQQVDAHDEALTLMKGYADHGDNAALKAFAAAAVPAIQGHDTMAKTIQSSLK